MSKIIINGKEAELGATGKDATINGQNTLEIVAGKNIDIEQKGGTLTISAIDSGSASGVYSTEETRIGTWVDGKPIYRRTIDSSFDCGSTIGTFIANIVDTTDWAIETVADIRAVLHKNTENDGFANAIGWIGDSVGIDTSFFNVWIRSSRMLSVAIKHQNNLLPIRIVTVIEYTKTTDQTEIQTETEYNVLHAAPSPMMATPTTMISAYLDEKRK